MTDNTFLETIKERVSESQKRWQQAQLKLNVAQQEFQASQLEFTNWQGVLQAEMRRLGQVPQLPHHPVIQAQPQPQRAAGGGLVVRAAPAQAGAVTIPAQPQPNPEPAQDTSNNSDVNKTELIREVLRQHPAGMTPKEIRLALKDEVSRDYIYAVLKRLKDRDQIMFQRKKRRYFMRVPSKVEEAKQPMTS